MQCTIRNVMWNVFAMGNVKLLLPTEGLLTCHRLAHRKLCSLFSLFVCRSVWNLLSHLIPSKNLLSSCIYLCMWVCECVCVCVRERERERERELFNSQVKSLEGWKVTSSHVSNLPFGLWKSFYGSKDWRNNLTVVHRSYIYIWIQIHTLFMDVFDNEKKNNIIYTQTHVKTHTHSSSVDLINFQWMDRKMVHW